MTPENAKALIPIITAYAEGKTIQLNTGSVANPSWTDASDCNFGCTVESYRIKPEPKMVPMTADELPPVFWIRSKGQTKMILVTCILDGSTLCWGIGNAIKAESFGSYEYSTDRKTWHSFMKEVTE